MYSRTAIINNYPYGESNKMDGVSDYIYRCRNCDTNLTSNTPANQYQRLKLIQNTVRVMSSLYSMNLAGLNAYQTPNKKYKVVNVAGTNYIVSPGVNWNQMSDRREPHTQVNVTPSGSTYGASSLKRSIVRLRPGSMSPGGSGVDIKHNSYDRYLNRLKGRAPLRRGVVPPAFGVPSIPFNPAFPIYGGKTMKTNIVNHCDCPIQEFVQVNGNGNDTRIYKDPFYYDINQVSYHFSVGDYVYAIEGNNDVFVKATIVHINEDGTYEVQFEDGTVEVKTIQQIKIYFPCVCDTENNDINNTIDNAISGVCLEPNYLELKSYF